MFNFRRLRKIFSFALGQILRKHENDGARVEGGTVEMKVYCSWNQELESGRNGKKFEA